ncbi:MAG: hypothetical protein NZM04_08255 [Methylacidiphilales bacterium]|nr:hypothetical protein [Candidatus Methylacidiphilales bacterium]MDW8349018.1 hypothetical protein [Verrucomicrobiae bacterium]
MSHTQRRSSFRRSSRSSTRGARPSGSRSREASSDGEHERRHRSRSSKPSLWSRILSFLGIRSEKTAKSSGRSRTRSASSASSLASRAEPEPFNPESITTPRLYVGNLSYDTTESDLYDVFTRYGVVKNVEIIMDRRTHRSKGFGFVEMETLSAARQAAEALHRTEFMGRTIVVSSAKSDPALQAAEADQEKSVSVENPSQVSTGNSTSAETPSTDSSSGSSSEDDPQGSPAAN